MASAINYQDSIASFTLIVDEIDTSLILVNGTSDFGSYGGQYRFVVQYLNSSGLGVLNGDVQILNITPSVGLSYGTFGEGDSGYYNITFTPLLSTAYTILISANMTNHH